MFNYIKAGKTNRYFDYQNIKELIKDNELIAGDSETWPLCLQLLVNKNRESIIKYFNARKKMNAAQIDGWYFPDYNNLENYNKYNELCKTEKELNSELFMPIKNEFKKQLKDNDIKIVFFHATKLINSEIESIKKDGLISSSINLIDKKLKAVKSLNLIDDKQYFDLFNLGTDRDQSYIRYNKTWFFNSIYQIINGSCDDLFNLWGGEIFYRGKLISESLRQKISSIGNPCLIIVSFNIEKIDYFDSGEDCLLDTMLYYYLDLIKHPIGCDLHIDNQIISVKDILIAQKNYFK